MLGLVAVCWLLTAVVSLMERGLLGLQASVAVACGIIGRWILNSWTTGEALKFVLIDIINQKILSFCFFKSFTRQFHHLVLRVGWTLVM